tara:strand:+ start:1454 stop:1678 length:225 start_codon:yes stop_codon:yes gene_type:complete
MVASLVDAAGEGQAIVEGVMNDVKDVMTPGNSNSLSGGGRRRRRRSSKKSKKVKRSKQVKKSKRTRRSKRSKRR